MCRSRYRERSQLADRMTDAFNGLLYWSELPLIVVLNLMTILSKGTFSHSSNKEFTLSHGYTNTESIQPLPTITSFQAKYLKCFFQKEFQRKYSKGGIQRKRFQGRHSKGEILKGRFQERDSKGEISKERFQGRYFKKESLKKRFWGRNSKREISKKRFHERYFKDEILRKRL